MAVACAFVNPLANPEDLVLWQCRLWRRWHTRIGIEANDRLIDTAAPCIAGLNIFAVQRAAVGKGIVAASAIGIVATAGAATCRKDRQNIARETPLGIRCVTQHNDRFGVDAVIGERDGANGRLNAIGIYGRGRRVKSGA